MQKRVYASSDGDSGAALADCPANRVGHGTHGVRGHFPSHEHGHPEGVLATGIESEEHLVAESHAVQIGGTMRK
jgi:hypothetical protein